MLGLPISTEIKKHLPKTLLVKKLNLKAEDRQLLDNSISRLELVNQISPHTIPALSEGQDVKSIFVLKVTLKKKNYDKRVLLLILKLVPQNLLLLLSYENEESLAVFHDKLLISGWRLDGTWNLSLVGTDLNSAWIALKSQISGISIPNGKDLSATNFSNQLRKEEEIARIKAKIAALQKAQRTEIQPRRKFEIHCKIQKLTAQINEGKQHDYT